MATRDRIRAGYEWACRTEIEALKPGNVHRFADGHDMTAGQFLASARASAPPLADQTRSTGQRILAAVQATRRSVGTNTNLGIILLSAPLARAAEIEDAALQTALAQVLMSMDIKESKAIYEAIVSAAPGGLGSSPAHDVREEPRVGIVEAMREAAPRDMIARQYINNFADIFGTGVEALSRAQQGAEGGMWPTVLVYLNFLAGFPDSHVARKHGLETAGRLRQEAVEVLSKVEGVKDETKRIEVLTNFDRRLKDKHLNPGTSADLTVATLFVHSLRSNLHNLPIDGSISARSLDP